MPHTLSGGFIDPQKEEVSTANIPADFDIPIFRPVKKCPYSLAGVPRLPGRSARFSVWLGRRATKFECSQASTTPPVKATRTFEETDSGPK
jgi:hypothetical protein